MSLLNRKTFPARPTFLSLDKGPSSQTISNAFYMPNKKMSLTSSEGIAQKLCRGG